MIKAFLRSLEDPDMRLVGPNHWAARRLGLLMPGPPLARALYLLMHATVTYFVITQFVELYITISDLDEVLTNVKISMLSSVCVFKADTFVMNHKRWKEVLDYVTEADEVERRSQDPRKQAVVEGYTRYCRRLTYCYWVMVFTTFLTTVFQPFMMYLTSSGLREGLRNGTAGFPHIFSSWMPFDKEHVPGCWLTVAWHVVVCVYGGFLMGAYDTIVVLVMVFLGGKLELLRMRCREELAPAAAGTAARRADFSAVVKEIHHTHVQLIKYSRLLNSLLSPVMFFYVLMCSLMLCASAYQLTSANNAAQKLYLAEYFLFGIAQLFLFCWHSNHVLVKSEEVVLGPYESGWWAAGARQQRDILMLAGQLRVSTVFTAGPFVDLTLSTFITILKGAYSYYTLLNNKS